MKVNVLYLSIKSKNFLLEIIYKKKQKTKVGQSHIDFMSIKNTIKLFSVHNAIANASVYYL